MKVLIPAVIAAFALLVQACSPNCGDANSGQGGCQGTDNNCYTCTSATATVWDGKSTATTALTCTDNPAGFSGCGAANAAGVYCCAGQPGGGGGSVSCDPGYCLSNGACCPSSTPHYCNGGCYGTMPWQCTTEKWGGCF